MAYVLASNPRLVAPLPSDRRAMTLVEIMVAVALTSVLLSVVISVSVGLQRWDSRFRSDRARRANLNQLAEMIRSDVRRAAAAPVAEQDRLVLTLPDQREIHYELQPDCCWRTIAQPGNTTESKVPYMIGKDNSWGVERVPSGRWPAIEVSLEGPAARDNGIQLPTLYVYASLGADLPNANSPEKTPSSKPVQ
jgi:prepilin-type N-terminal cleavage/methylation domain-containing protein